MNHPDGEQVYFFRHALVRDAAYGLFPPQERGALHRGAIEGYEALYAGGIAPHAEELLQHARAALEFAPGDAESMRRTEHAYLAMAADHCARAWRVDDELQYLVQLERHPCTTPGERSACMLRRVRHLLERGSLRDAENLAGEILEVADAAGSEALRLEARYLRFRARYEGGRVEDESELARLIAHLERRGASRPLSQAFIDRGVARERAGDPQGAEAAYRRAVEIARELKDPHSESESLAERGLFYHRTSRTPQGEADIDEALEIARRHNDKKLELQCLNRLGIMHVDSGRRQEAAESYERALEMAHKIGARASEATISNNLANLHFYFFGNLGKAERVYLRSREFFFERGDVHALGHSNGVLGLMYVESGEYEKARACFEIVCDQARLQGDRVMEAKGFMGLAMSLPLDAPVEVAAAAFEDALLRLSEARVVASLPRTWASFAGRFYDAGHFAAGHEALVRAESFTPTNRRVQAVRTLYALLVDDDGEEQYRRFTAHVGPDHPPQAVLGHALLFRLLVEAGSGAGLATLKATREEMLKVAATFESARYSDARRALEWSRAVIDTHRDGRDGLWRGLPRETLPKGLANALSNPDVPGSTLREIAPRAASLPTSTQGE